MAIVARHDRSSSESFTSRRLEHERHAWDLSEFRAGGVRRDDARNAWNGPRGNAGRLRTVAKRRRDVLWIWLLLGDLRRAVLRLLRRRVSRKRLPSGLTTAAGSGVLRGHCKRHGGTPEHVVYVHLDSNPATGFRLGELA
jgi:hypothetical protein